MNNSFKGISVLSLPLNEAVYTFVDGETGQPTHIAASTLLATVKRAGVIPELLKMGGGLIEAIERGDLNVEEPHALRLSDEALEMPVLVGQWGEQHIIIDGSHRLWRRWKRGDRDFPAYMVPERAWRHFVIRDMPGDGEFWDRFNRNAKVRTPELEAFLRSFETGAKP